MTTAESSTSELDSLGSAVFWDVLAEFPTNLSPEEREQKKEEFKNLIAEGIDVPQNLTYLAFLSPEPQTLRDGRRLTKTELYKHAIAIDSSYGPAYRGLAYTMYNSPGGGPRAKTTLEDGTTMTVVDLCKKSLELEVGSGKSTNLAAAYNALGYVLGKTMEKKVTVLEREWTQKELLAKAVSCRPNYAKYYYNLGFALTMTEQVDVPERGPMNKRELFEEAIRVDPEYSDGYYGLGFVEKDFKKKRMLFKKAIELNKKNAKAYKGLAYTLSSNERIELMDKLWSKRELEGYAKELMQKQSAPSPAENSGGLATLISSLLKYLSWR